MSGIFDDLERHIRSNPDDLPDEAIQGFLQILESVRLQDMPCSEVFAQLDQYVERELRDHSAAKLMPLLKEHLEICPDCCNEYEALMRAIEHTKPSGNQTTLGTAE